MTLATLLRAMLPARSGPGTTGWRLFFGMASIAGPSIVAGTALLVAPRIATADSSQGARLAASCTSCHRLDGHDEGIPTIVGQDAESLARMMQAFKSGERPGMIMHAVALTLTEEEIATVSRYLAEQGKERKQP
ncbi:MAG: c-type cytochrome [Kiloniellales bacterium]